VFTLTSKVTLYQCALITRPFVLTSIRVFRIWICSAYYAKYTTTIIIAFKASRTCPTVYL